MEWSITAGGFAWFALLVILFVKVFPIMAVYEMVEEREELAAKLEVDMAEVEAEREAAAGKLETEAGQ